jgi:hypothetical protein
MLKNSFEKELHYDYYEEMAINMAIRHPDALKYTKYYILYGYIEDINEDIDNYLYNNFGISFESFKIFEDEGGEIHEEHYLSDSEIIISKIPKVSTGLLSNIVEKPVHKELIDLEKIKLCPEGKNKGCVKLKSITDDVFTWYDSKYKISSKSMYSIDPSGNNSSEMNRKVKILHHYIINKKWEEILPFY